MTRIVVTFDRVGRDHHVLPLRITDATLTPVKSEIIAEAIHTYVAARLFSRDTWVTIDLEHRTGTIHAGFRNAGSFTMREEDDQ